MPSSQVLSDDDTGPVQPGAHIGAVRDPGRRGGRWAVQGHGASPQRRGSGGARVLVRGRVWRGGGGGGAHVCHPQRHRLPSAASRQGATGCPALLVPRCCAGVAPTTHLCVPVTAPRWRVCSTVRNAWCKCAGLPRTCKHPPPTAPRFHCWPWTTSSTLGPRHARRLATVTPTLTSIGATTHKTHGQCARAWVDMPRAMAKQHPRRRLRRMPAPCTSARLTAR